MCGHECESVSHVLWECPAYNICRSDFTAKLQDFLGEGFQDFQSLDSQGKSSFVLGSELWDENFSSLFELVKGYVLRIWELRKAKLYHNHNVQQSSSQSASGVLPGVTTGLDKNQVLCGKAGASINSINCISLSSSAQCSGCVVDGLGAMAAV